MVKKILLSLILFFIAAGLIVYFSQSQKIEITFKGLPETSPAPDVSGAKNEAEPVELTADQKIGQLFIVSISGKTVDSKTEQFIKEYHPGGILLLGQNIKSETQLKSLILNLQKIALNDTGLPLFIAVDQEGGAISRIKWAEKTPQADIGNAAEAYSVAKKRGGDLAKDFINLNFSPVLDAAVKGDFVYDRIFRGNSGELAKSMVSGYNDSMIFSCLKHFPGYVGISFNPEDKLAAVDKIPEVSQFAKAAQANPEFVMVSNVIYRDLDKSLPFSFSKSGIDFLKKEIPGDYIIISDDLSQYSLLNNYSLENIVSSPINAGMDMLIFSNWRKDPKEGMDAFKKAVESGNVSQERIDEAVLKIIKLKQKTDASG